MSPAAFVMSGRSSWGWMLSRRNWTCPSANAAIAPPVWKLKISSFGPQLLPEAFQLQLDGPPNGVGLLLIALFPLPVVNPDTPNPLSCSAHRQNFRLELP